MDKIYYLSEYNWELGVLIKENSKTYTIKTTPRAFFSEQTIRINKEKCALPDDVVCIVWETWKGKNGRGSHRVERELYPDKRVPANSIARQLGIGRVTEINFGVEQ